MNTLDINGVIVSITEDRATNQNYNDILESETTERNNS